MKLISCHVENFGRLHDFDYVFTDGINVICRENGWGKSTFAAFLLAMFYGLPVKGKKGQAASSGSRLPLQNARVVYKPWQGGVFGGKLIFETGGRTYEMTRIFGDREAQDEFDLRDFDTNLPCFDYTKNIGRELFLMNRESFVRTVFTAQQDCLTRTTDDVNALIADLAENAGDMESYEAAQLRLKEAANRLTPKRSTGRLHRLEDRIGELRQRTAASHDLDERIAECGRKQKELEEKKAALEAERSRLGEEIAVAEQKEEIAAAKERADQSLLAKKEIWERLYRTNQRRRESLREYSSYFPGRIPSKEETDALLRSCREIERLEERVRTQMLTEEEQERLTILEEEFDESAASAEKTESARDERMPFSDRIGESTLLMPAGILILMIGTVLFVFAISTGTSVLAAGAIILVAVGGGLAAVGFMAYREKSGPTGSAGPIAGPARMPGSRTSTGRSVSGEESDRAREEYLYLANKEEKLEEIHAEWVQARKPVLRFIKELGFIPEKDLHSQLTEIRDAADDCEDAAVMFRESEEELRVFEEELSREGLAVEDIRQAGTDAEAARSWNPDTESKETGADPAKHVPQKAAALRRRREEVNEELPGCAALIADTKQEMEDLICEREEREALLEELRDLREQQEMDLAEYHRIKAASALLRAAHESLTARYADPIRIAFTEYWEMITGYSAADVYLDSDSNITIEEKGRQRDASLFSTGWRDLSGICLRIALADAMYPQGRRESPPLILDDPFTNLDDEKLEGAMRFLRETGKRYQILYFTCSTARC